MGKRRKVRKGVRLVSVKDEGEDGGPLQAWWFASREATGTELCGVEGCDGSCDRWHVL